MSASSAARPRLVVTGGPLDGREVAFEDGAERRFGTGPDCDLQVQAGHIEPLHATVLLEEGRLVLNDAGSVAGTYVNGEKVGTGRELFDGDRVCLGPPGFRGSVKMVVTLAAAPAEEAAPVLLDPADFAPATTGAEPALAESQSGPIDLGGGGDEGFRLDDAGPAGADGDDWTLAAPSEPEAPLVALEPEPEPEAPAPPPPAAPASPPAPAAAPASPKAARTATAEDYSSGISIGPETPRDAAPRAAPAPLPAPARPSPRDAGPRPGTDWKRVLMVNGGITLAAVLALVAWRTFNRPTPSLSSLSAAKARGGEVLTVSGVHLGGEASDWTVRFGDLTAAPTAVTDESLTVAVPAQLAKQGPPHVPVSVEGPGGRSNELLLSIVRGPSVTAIEPDVALPGQSVRLRGTNLAGERVTVTIGGQAATVTPTSPTEIQVVVPEVPGKTEGAAVDVTVQVAGETGAPAKLLLGRLPMLTQAEPSGGGAGDRVTLRGRGFDASAPANQVSFDGTPALVVSAKPDALVVAVPPLLGAADVGITVQNGAGTSVRAPFRYQAPSAATYVPRFVATPVAEHPGHDHAFVATALGPVLLLSGPAGGRSVAERAAGAADALNALAAQVTPGQVVPFSVRGDAEPAVVAAGRPEPVVTVTAADAAAFGEAWTGLKPASPSATALAAYWAALLQDHLTLFAAHARPLKLLELTPRGQVLLDVWSQAVRQGHGPDGVPVRMLTPVPDGLARGLRELALSAPGGKAEGAAALAVSGTWQGEVTENGQRKLVRMRLSVAGKGLSGVLSMQSGAVTMDMPLKDVTYRNGELRFRVLAGGSPRTFHGLFDGRQVNGTIAGATGPIGDFRLELVE